MLFNDRSLWRVAKVLVELLHSLQESSPELTVMDLGRTNSFHHNHRLASAKLGPCGKLRGRWARKKLTAPISCLVCASSS